MRVMKKSTKAWSMKMRLALLALAANAFGGYIASDKGTPDTNWKRKQAQKKASRPPKKLR